MLTVCTQQSLTVRSKSDLSWVPIAAAKAIHMKIGCHGVGPGQICMCAHAAFDYQVTSGYNVLTARAKKESCTDWIRIK